MAKEDGFLGLFQKLTSDPTCVLLGAEQIDALATKLRGTALGKLFPNGARGWRGRLFLQIGGGAPTFRVIEKISSQPKRGLPLAYDATFSFDGGLISENTPNVARQTSNKSTGFRAATGAILRKAQPARGNTTINNKQRG